MNWQSYITAANLSAAVLVLAPYLAATFFPDQLTRIARQLPVVVRILLPAALAVSYLLVTCSAGNFRWQWLAVYAVLPPAIAALLQQAAEPQTSNPGNWREFLVLAVLGLAVDLRWFEGAWPA